MRTILAILITLLSFSTHSEEWAEWRTEKWVDPMTDETEINLFIAKQSPVRTTHISCSQEGILGAGLSTKKTRFDQTKNHVPAKIRFDRKPPFTLTSLQVRVDDRDKTAFFVNDTDVKQILDGLKTARERLVYQIDDGQAEVIPLTGFNKATKEFEQHCPYYPWFQLSD